MTKAPLPLATLVAFWLTALPAVAQTADPVPPPPSGSSTPEDALGAPVVPASAPELPPNEDTHRTLRVGLLVGLISVPRVVNVEVLVKIADLFGVGVSYAYLPGFVSEALLSLYGVHDASLTSSALELDLRLYPFRGSFFIGASLGSQVLTATATRFGVTGNADVATLYVAPRLGWVWIWKSGFSLSTDVAVQIPFGTPEIKITGADYKEVHDAARYVGQLPVPAINFRIGYFF